MSVRGESHVVLTLQRSSVPRKAAPGNQAVLLYAGPEGTTLFLALAAGR